MIGKLGKNPREFSRKLIHIENYLDFQTLDNLGPLPDPADWTQRVSGWTKMGNDKAGCCVVAGAGHWIQVETSVAGRHEELLTEGQVLGVYSQLSGYDPRTGANDNGLALLSFLNFWQRTGFLGHRLGAFAGINPQNEKALRYACHLFGAVYLGFMLPNSIQGQEVWAIPAGGMNGDGAPGSLGGHCVIMPYAGTKLHKVVTWGGLQPIDPNFMAYSDEAYVLMGLEWFDVNHKTPTGLAWKDALLDIGKVARLPNG